MTLLCQAGYERHVAPGRARERRQEAMNDNVCWWEVRPCIACGWLFVSCDACRNRRCTDCQQEDAQRSRREMSRLKSLLSEEEKEDL